MKNKRGQISITGILTNFYFWLILLAMAITGIGMRWMRKIHISKKMLIVISVIGLLFASGLVSLAMFNIGSIGSGYSSGVTINRIQTTTAFTFDNDTGGIDIADVGVDNTRMSVFYLSEVQLPATDGIIEAGIFSVTRNGPLTADSCQVRVIKPPRYEISDTTYHLINEDASTGVMNAYVMAAASSSAADTADPKESAMLPFAEGVSTGYVSFLIEIDGTGWAPLTQYDSKDIQTDICGYPYTFRLVKSDA